MADFCKRCSLDLFDKDYGDMKGLCGVDEVALVLCEGCGQCWVDSEGRCTSTDCLKKHGSNPIQKDGHPTVLPDNM